MDIERLIDEVRRFPVLYDQAHEKYRNSEYKDKVWKKIATVLEAKGGVEECKKKWSSIRDQLRRTLQKRKSGSGQGVVHRHKYKYEDLLTFLVPTDETTVSNVSCSQDGEDDLDEKKSAFADTHEEESIVEEEALLQFDVKAEAILQVNIDEESAHENPETQIENVTNSSLFSEQFTGGPSLTSKRKDGFIKPLLKRKIHRETKLQDSPSGLLMAYILAEKEAEKQGKRLAVERAEQNPVDAFLAGIAPPLKSLNPILFNKAKGLIFAIVQELELNQLMGNHPQYMDGDQNASSHL